MLRGSRFASRIVRQRAEAATAQTAKWQDAVGPFSLPSYSAKWKSMMGSVIAKNDFAVSVPKEVGSVDFAKFEKVIEDKAAVKEIKAAYDAAMSAKGPDAETATGPDNSKMVDVMTKWQNIANERITELKAELAKAKETRDTIGEWDLQDYYNSMPGLEAQLVEEFEENKYWSTDEEEKLADIDYAALKERLANGVLSGPGLETCPETLGDLNVADYLADSANLKEELKNDIRNAVDASVRPGLESGFDAIEKEWQAAHPAL